jgi:GNAT superfamily N-acetyltransferase
MTLIRLATPSDIPEIARVHVRAWQVAYRGQVPDAYLEELQPSHREALWSRVVAADNVTVLVAIESASVVAFCSLLPSRDDDALATTGEIAAIYVEPDRWRRGIGAALLDAALDVARGRSFETLTLWVLSANSPARAFYESRGFAADGRSKTDTSLGFPLHSVRYKSALRAK